MTQDTPALVRSRLAELRGYLSAADSSAKVYYGADLANNVNTVIQELATATSADYSRFRVDWERGDTGPWVNAADYRSKLSALIGRLEEEFGLGAQPGSGGLGAGPGGGGAVTLTLNQTLSQLTHIGFTVELGEAIDEKIQEVPEDSNERRFLDRLKESLATVKDAASLLGLIASSAKATGVAIDDIAKIFGPR
jgi:hypothetical protein